ncbi:MAG: phosphopantetheine-binding protein, partial [Candidatus Binatia bacterium]
GMLIAELMVSPELLATSTSSTPLLGRGIGLDSMETLTLVAAIEKEFAIQIADEDLTVNLFASIATVAEYVLQERAKQRSGSTGGVST